jgi:hypothetical protein
VPPILLIEVGLTLKRTFRSIPDATPSLLCQILADRWIIGAPILALRRLTEQAKLDAENQQGERLAVVLTRTAFAAASPHLYVPPRSNRPIVIWYGEELTERARGFGAGSFIEGDRDEC